MAGVASKTPAARPPLDAGALREALVASGGFWRDIRVVAETGSTNSDLLAEAKRGLAEGAVLAAETQSAGRGRMGRHWVSPPRAALAFSVLLRPTAVPPASRGWVPLLTGVAVAAGPARARQAVDAWLKWPNDVQVNGAKLAGILAEQAGDAIVVGTGINVSTTRDELPRRTTPRRPTSLALEGARTDRDRLLAGVLSELERWYLAWAAASGTRTVAGSARSTSGCAGPSAGRSGCQLPGGATVTGAACEVDAPAGWWSGPPPGWSRSAPGTWSMSGDRLR